QEAFLNNVFNPINSNYEYDCFGQFHFKYINEIIRRKNEYGHKSPQVKTIKSVPLAIFLGVGLGYQLAETFERAEIGNVIFIEPDLDLFYASLFVFDWKNLLTFINSSKIPVRFIIGDKTAHIALYLTHFFMHNGKFLSVVTQIFSHYSSEHIEKIKKDIRDLYTHLYYMGFFDDYVFGVCHTCFALTNNKSFVNNSKLKKNYQTLPVFVVGSGPSLDNNIGFLRKNQDKAIIIACGTSIDSLYHAGIQPDFYANTERTTGIGQALNAIPDEEFLKNVILLSTNICNPKTYEYFKHTALFAKDNEYHIKQLSGSIHKLNNIRTIEGINPLVGNMGVSSALHLGFKKLYLFGLDNGKAINTENVHSKYTKLYNKLGVNDKSGIYNLPLKVKGNFGGEVESNELYQDSVFRIGKIIKDFQEKDRDIMCINCSAGCFIANTVPKHDYELSDSFERKSTIDKVEFHKYINEEKTISFKISEEDVKKVFDIVKYRNLVNEIAAKLDLEADSRIKCIKKFEDISVKLCDLLYSQQMCLDAEAINSSLQQMLMYASSVLYSKENENQCLKETKELINVIKDFLDETVDVFEKIPDYSLGFHYKYYPDGKVGKDKTYCKAPALPEKYVLTRAQSEHTHFEKRNN
nr:DUF115 domain-containing protein [Treponema sp.]